MQMKHWRQYFAAFFLLSIFLIDVASGKNNGTAAAPIKNLGALQNGGSIKVSWWSTSEDGVSYYEVVRSSDLLGPYLPLPNIKIAPLGDNQFYSIDDNCELFKSQGKFFYYKVRVVLADGSARESDPVSTYYNSTSSAAKRTWGSIKAMFR